MDRKARIVVPEQGRTYSMGRMQAVFVADLDETLNQYSVSEWWLDPRTQGPHQHFHDDDHVYYVLEGTLDVQIGDDWDRAPKGAYILIPGGTPHAFENRGAERTGFISFTAPGGFEERMPSIEVHMSSIDLTIE